MIPRILAIALLAIRAAVRSRVVLALGALLLLTLLGLPGWVRGDGTPRGAFVLLVGHTLAACFLLLAATTLWAGCAAMAAERAGGTAVLTAVKPVRPIELWVGKWLGIVVLAALLLAAAAAGLWLQIRVRADELPADWRRCHRVVACQRPEPAAEAERLLRRLRDEGRMPTDATEAELRAGLIREIRNRYELIHPGESKTWRFRIPGGVAAAGQGRGTAVVLRAVFETQFALRQEAALSVRAEIAGTGTEAFAADAKAMAGEPLALALPATLAVPGSVVAVTFRLDPSARAPLLLHPGRNLALLFPGIGFTANLARAALALLAVLAAFAACGLALGCCFSFPVASFAAAAVVLLSLIGACTGSGEASGGGEPPAERVGRRVIAAGTALARPFLDAAPVGRLARSEEIPARGLLPPLAAGGVAAPVALALLSAFVLRRRENGA